MHNVTFKGLAEEEGLSVSREEEVRQETRERPRADQVMKDLELDLSEGLETSQ